MFSKFFRQKFLFKINSKLNLKKFFLFFKKKKKFNKLINNNNNKKLLLINLKNTKKLFLKNLKKFYFFTNLSNIDKNKIYLIEPSFLTFDENSNFVKKKIIKFKKLEKNRL